MSKSYEGCQLYSMPPSRYPIVLSNQCTFNFDFTIDVVYTNSSPVPHIICEKAHYIRAAIISNMDFFTFWLSFMQTRVILCFGVSFKFWVDQANAFLSAQFTALSKALGCSLISTAVETHWSLISERYHASLRRMSQTTDRWFSCFYFTDNQLWQPGYVTHGRTWRIYAVTFFPFVWWCCASNTKVFGSQPSQPSDNFEQ